VEFSKTAVCSGPDRWIDPADKVSFGLIDGTVEAVAGLGTTGEFFVRAPVAAFFATAGFGG
jgi:hypothetical protein